MSQLKCSPDGNIGFPINIIGDITPEILKKITKETVIQFQFNETRATPITLDKGTGFFDENAQNTVLFQGGSYNCIGGQITQPSIRAGGTVTPLQYSFGIPVVDIVLWFAKRSNVHDTIVLHIPVYSTDNSQYIDRPSVTQTYIQSMTGSHYVSIETPIKMNRRRPISMKELVDSFDSKRAFSYVSCIDLKSGSSARMTVVYFPSTGYVHKDWFNIWKKNTFDVLKDVRLPRAIYSGTETAARYTLSGLYQAPSVWSNQGAIGSTTVIAGDSSFSRRFVFYPTAYNVYGGSTSDKMTQDKNQAISQYKCVRLNPDYDISNGYVTINPYSQSSGLDTVLKDKNEELTQERLELAKLEDAATVQPGDIGRLVGILFGVLAAVLVVGWIIWYIVRRSDAVPAAAALPPVPAAVLPPAGAAILRPQ